MKSLKLVSAIASALGVAGLVFALLSPAGARNPRGYPIAPATPSGPVNYIGSNLTSPNYFSTEEPFLNLVNGASNNYPSSKGHVSAWSTTPAEGGGSDGNLRLDSSGYVTSLTPVSSSGVTAGAAYTNAYLIMNRDLQAYGGSYAPNQTQYYPSGSYTLQYTGNGTLTLGGDAVGLGNSSGSGYSITGGGLTLTITDGGTHSVAFDVNSPSTTGLTLTESAIGPTSYPNAFYLVQTAYLSAATGGEFFHPLFKQMLKAMNISRIRAMEWSNVWNMEKPITFAGDVPSGSTSATLLSPPALAISTLSCASNVVTVGTSSAIPGGVLGPNGNSSAFSVTVAGAAPTGYNGTYSSTATGTNTFTYSVGSCPGTETSLGTYTMPTAFPDGWDLPTGVYNVQFIDGEVRAVTFTWGAYTATWSAVTTADNPYGATYLPQAFVPYVQSWASRPHQTDLAFTTPKGVPYEVQIDLANELNVDYWTNTFAAASTNVMADTLGNYNTQWASLVLANLHSGGHVFVEVSNEPWNGAGKSYYYVNSMGQSPNYFPSQGSAQKAGMEFYGVQTAIVANSWYAVWGSSAFGSRVTVTMNTQTASNGATLLEDAMNAPDWTALGGGKTAPYLSHIGAWTCAPYITWPSTFSSTDAGNFLAESSGQQVTSMYYLLYSNSDGINTYSSLPSSGLEGNQVSIVSGIVSGISGQAWGLLPIEMYEIGTSINPSGMGNLSGSQQTAMTVTMTAFDHDARTKYAFYDPTGLLFSTYGITPANGKTGYFSDLKSFGTHTGNIHTDATQISTDGEWGFFESMMQSLTPGSLPPKAQGVANYAQ